MHVIKFLQRILTVYNKTDFEIHINSIRTETSRYDYCCTMKQAHNNNAETDDYQ